MAQLHLVLALIATTAAAVPTIFWVSNPALPGDSISVSGSGFVSNCSVNLSAASSGSSYVLSPEPGTVFDAALVVTLPLTAALDAYALTVMCPEGSSSSMWVNQADPWWLQGDAGAAASPGGWVRVYGQVLALEPATRISARKAARVAARQISTAGASLGTAGLLAAAAAAVEAAAAAAAITAFGPTSLRLTPLTGGSPIDVVAENATTYAAVFLLPSSLPLGEYNASVSNGAGGFAPLSTFVSPAQPSVSGLSIVPPPTWPPGVFPVTATSVPMWGPGVNTSDAALAAALAAAASAGGGTVLLSPGSFFLTAPVLLPPNTLLRGSGRVSDAAARQRCPLRHSPPPSPLPSTFQEATKITFAEWNTTTAPAAPLFSVNESAVVALGGAAWGVSDLEGKEVTRGGRG